MFVPGMDQISAGGIFFDPRLFEIEYYDASHIEAYMESYWHLFSISDNLILTRVTVLRIQL